MTPEGGEDGIRAKLLDECDCSFFRKLSFPEQVKNKGYRETAIKGNEVPGAPNSMCGECMRLKLHNLALSS